MISIQKGKLEQANYWTAELICSGHFLELWETIILYYGKNIHLGNPKIAVYLQLRFTIFQNIAKQLYESCSNSYLQLRNNEKIRKLFSEIIGVLCFSPKKHCIELIKIKRTEEFDITYIPDKLKATSAEYINSFFKKKDPKELIIPLNEFSFNISKGNYNTLLACYWIEWIIEFDLICKLQKRPCICERRLEYDIVENKYQTDIVWLIWDALFYYCSIQTNEFIENIMNSLLQLFCIKYTSSCSKKRRYILYMAVGLITEYVNNEIEIIDAINKEKLKNLVENIYNIYIDIKKNEENPKMDYLFTGLHKENNLECSMNKLNKVNHVCAIELQTPNQLLTL
jgi:hypothetical protein